MRVGVLATGQVVAIQDDDVFELAGVDIRSALSDRPGPGNRIGTVADMRFAAPYVPGAKIVCHVVNYEAHATGVGPPSQPYFFTKPSSSVLDPSAPIQPHTHISKELDWETELAVVFGREARDVSESEAYDVICGLHDPE